MQAWRGVGTACGWHSRSPQPPRPQGSWASVESGGENHPNSYETCPCFSASCLWTKDPCFWSNETAPPSVFSSLGAPGLMRTDIY